MNNGRANITHGLSDDDALGDPSEREAVKEPTTARPWARLVQRRRRVVARLEARGAGYTSSRGLERENAVPIIASLSFTHINGKIIACIFDPRRIDATLVDGACQAPQ
jgi:hypothetical protein